MSDGKLTDGEILVRQAKKEDMTSVFEMIQELADFEKMPDGPKLSVEGNITDVINTSLPTELERDGFGSSPPAFRCKVAECRAPPGGQTTVGYALYFPSYSTWRGPALMLEDLYVRPHMRRRGVGRRLFDAVAKEAHSSGCSRLDFHVLEWNEARAFYESKGAVNLTGTEQWCYYRLAGDALQAVAAAAAPAGEGEH